MKIILILGIIHLLILIGTIVIIWYDIFQQKYAPPKYTKEELETYIKKLKEEIKHKIANGEGFRLESDLDYLEYYENELKKYQKEK